MINQTYSGSPTVHVDEKTAEFVEEAEVRVEENRKKLEKMRKIKTDRALFELGASDFLRQNICNFGFYENSDPYFHGYNYARKLSAEINKSAKESYPLTGSDPNFDCRLYELAEALSGNNAGEKT